MTGLVELRTEQTLVVWKHQGRDKIIFRALARSLLKTLPPFAPSSRKMKPNTRHLPMHVSPGITNKISPRCSKPSLQGMCVMSDHIHLNVALAVRSSPSPTMSPETFKASSPFSLASLYFAKQIPSQASASPTPVSRLSHKARKVI
jgi:hypothetical protein